MTAQLLPPPVSPTQPSLTSLGRAATPSVQGASPAPFGWDLLSMGDENKMTTSPFPYKLKPFVTFVPLTRRPRILCLGDFLWDVYHLGEISRLSEEAPIPIVKITPSRVGGCVWTSVIPGGVGNVKANLEAMGAEVVLFTGHGVIYKHRLMVGDRQIARWDEENKLNPINFGFVLDQINQVDAIIVSDYGKGSFNNANRATFNKLKLDIPIFIDTKSDPYLWRSDATFFPNLKESLEHNYKGLKIVLKLGAVGLDGREGSGYLPAWARFVRSTCGAGDSVIAAYAYATIVGHKNPLAFANAAASVVCEKPYTATASIEEIEEVLKRVEKA